jgi:hypothetical protein
MVVYPAVAFFLLHKHVCKEEDRMFGAVGLN